MDRQLRRRLDLIIGLLTFIAISVASLVLWTGGLVGLAFVGGVGFLVGLLVQGLSRSSNPLESR
ncbi:MAG: hypothetical protein ACI8TL_000563 [Natronomonas sp.]|jgi:hypothetical protein